MEKLERRVEILKFLQGKTLSTDEIAVHFGVTDRTLRSEIDSLREGFNVLGMTFKIESKHIGSQKHYYKSTIHPIMLGLNLSELLSLLKILESKKGGLDKEVYQDIFKKIYGQMTDYAESIIAPRLEGKYDRGEIINRLEEEAYEKYVGYKLAFWSKSGKYITINYLDENKKIVSKEVRLIDIKGSRIKVKDREDRAEWFDYGDLAIDWSNEDYR